MASDLEHPIRLRRRQAFQRTPERRFKLRLELVARELHHGKTPFFGTDWITNPCRTSRQPLDVCRSQGLSAASAAAFASATDGYRPTSRPSCVRRISLDSSALASAAASDSISPISLSHGFFD